MTEKAKGRIAKAAQGEHDRIVVQNSI